MGRNSFVFFVIVFRYFGVLLFWLPPRLSSGSFGIFAILWRHFAESLKRSNWILWIYFGPFQGSLETLFVHSFAILSGSLTAHFYWRETIETRVSGPNQSENFHFCIRRMMLVE